MYVCMYIHVHGPAKWPVKFTSIYIHVLFSFWLVLFSLPYIRVDVLLGGWIRGRGGRVMGGKRGERSGGGRRGGWRREEGRVRGGRRLASPMLPQNVCRIYWAVSLHCVSQRSSCFSLCFFVIFFSMAKHGVSICCLLSWTVGYGLVSSV